MKSVVYVWAYYTLCRVCMVTSRRTLAAAEGDAIGEQQLKRMQSGVVAKADAIGAQFGLTM